MSNRVLALLAALAAIPVLLFLILPREPDPTAPELRSGGSATESPADPGQTALEELEQEPEDVRRELAPTPVAAGSGDTWAISGSVTWPAECGADTRVEVFALGRAFQYRGVARRMDSAWTDAQARTQWNQQLLARAPVAVDGTFRLDVPAERDTVHLMLRGDHVFLPESRAVDAGAARVVLEPLGGTFVRGTVRAPEGTDLDALKVEVRSLPGELDPAARDERLRVNATLDVDAAGRFELRATPALTYDVAVLPEDLAATLKVLGGLVPCGDHELAFELTAGAEITGSVVCGGVPVGAASVQALVRGRFFGLDDRPVRTTESAADGTFRLSGVMPGELVLRARKTGFLESKKAQVLVPSEAEGPRVLPTAYVLELREGGSIAGSVAWEDGAPAPDLRVRVGFDPAHMAGMGGLSMMSGAKSEARTDAAGHFRVAGLGGGPFIVACEAQGDEQDEGSEPLVFRARADGVKPGTTGLELTLRRPAVLAGRIVSTFEGRPRTFTVSARRRAEGALDIRDLDDADYDDEGNVFGFMGGARSSDQFEDAEGEFQLPIRIEGTHEVSAAADGWVTPEPVTVVLARAGAMERIEIPLVPVASAGGIVRTPEGTALAGATVRAQKSGTNAIEALVGKDSAPSARTDAEGRFHLKGLSPGSIDLTAEADGYARSAPVTVDLEPAGETRDIELELTFGGTISGLVYAANGDPASGRIVSLTSLATYESDSTISDARGEFTAQQLEPGTWQVTALDLSADWTGSGEGLDMGSMLKSIKMAQAEVVEGEVAHVVLGAPAAEPVHVHGRVTLDGAAFEGVLVSFFPEGTRLYERLAFADTDESGHYEVEVDGPGSYVASVQRIGSAPGEQQTIEYSITIPETADHRLDFEVPLGRISGTVRGPDGAPAKGARITLTRELGSRTDNLFGGGLFEVQTDDGGEYDLVGLRPGTYRVSAGGAALLDLGGAPPSLGRVTRGGLELEEGDWLQDVDLDLVHPGSLAVRVLGPDGDPAGGASVFLRDADGRIVEPLSLRSTDGSGAVTITGLAPGRYSSLARARGLASSESGAFDVSAGETAQVALTLEVGAVLWVKVRDPQGEPAGASVIVRDKAGREWSGMFGAQDLQILYSEGGFSTKEQRLGPVPPGRYTIEATADGARAKKSVTVRAGMTERKVTLRLKAR